MKGKIIGIMAILVIVTLVFAVVVLAKSEFWETPWEPDPEPDEVTGSWGQEIILEYADGTNESLKIVCDEPLSIWSGDKEIRGIHYVLNAKAEGTGYSTILYDITGYWYDYEAVYGTNSNDWSTSCVGYSLADRPVDGEWHQLIHHYTSADDIIPDTFPPGSYTVTVTPGGYIKYSADGEAQVTAPNLPDVITFTLLVKQDKSISVSFSSGYEVFE